MSFFSNQPDLVTRVRWFFADPAAVALPFPTRFGSGNWASEKDKWTGPGEVLPRQRRWSNGANVPFYDGQIPCGTADQFLNGTLYPPGPFPRNGDNVPFCCLPPPTCEEFWGFVNVSGGYIDFTLSGFSDDGSVFPPCDVASPWNMDWNGTSATVVVGALCTFIYNSNADVTREIRLILETPPNVVMEFFATLATTNVINYVGSVPMPPMYPISWPQTVTLDDDTVGLCTGQSTYPASITVTLMPRLEHTEAGSVDLSFGVSAVVS